MSGDLNVALRITSRDDGSKVVSNSLKEVAKNTEAVNKANAQADSTSKSWSQNSSKGAKVVSDSLKAVAKSTEEAARSTVKLGDEQKRANDAAVSGSRTLSEEYRRSASARETLGIRAERTIQREIQQTEAAYNRLTRSSTLSAQEQTRAYNAMKTKVGELRREMAGLSNDAKTGSSFLQNGLSIAGGVAAGTALLSGPAFRQMSYDRKLASLSNTAFNERGVKGRISGKAELNSAAENAVKQGGGTMDQAADTLGVLLGSGAVDAKSAISMLPTIQKAATATNANPEDLANIAIALKRNFNIGEKDLPRALDLAVSAGQEGSFELADMAKFLPQQLAVAGKMGMRGFDDYITILAANQAAATTAGTSSEAGNNLVQLLNKITSKDTSNAAANIKLNGKGIDLAGSLAAAREKGINPIDAFMGIVDKVIKGDKGYQKLQTKLKTATGAEREETIAAMAKILESSAIGQLINDQQSLSALIGYRNGDYVKNTKNKIANSKDQIQTGYLVMADTNSFKVEQLNNQKQMSENRTFESFNNVLGDTANKLTEYASHYPGLTDAVTTATYAFGTAAAVVGAGLLINRATGGTKGEQGAAAVIARVFSESGSVFLRGLSKLAVPLQVATLPTMTTDDEDDEIWNGKARWAALREKNSQDVIDKARERYQPWYQFGDGYARENEEWVNKYLADEKSGKPHDEKSGFSGLMNSWFGGNGTPQSLNNATQQPSYPANLTIKSELVLDGRKLAEAVNEVNTRSANRR